MGQGVSQNYTPMGPNPPQAVYAYILSRYALVPPSPLLIYALDGAMGVGAMGVAGRWFTARGAARPARG